MAVKSGYRTMTTIAEQVRTSISQALGVELPKVTDELTIGDIPEWDSLGHANVLQNLEKDFEITLDITDAVEAESVSDLIELIEKYKTV